MEILHFCWTTFGNKITYWKKGLSRLRVNLLSGEPDYFGRKKISSGGDLSHYSSASLY